MTDLTEARSPVEPEPEPPEERVCAKQYHFLRPSDGKLVPLLVQNFEDDRA